MLTRGELKALALFRALAAKLQEDPAVIERALNRLTVLAEQHPHAQRYYSEWNQLLKGDRRHLLETMTSDSEHACALRQESPFAGVIPQAQRAAIFRSVAERLGSANADG